MKTAYLCPLSHYDVVWALDQDDYLVLNERILSKAAEMVLEGDFRFLVEQTQLLVEMEHRFPRLFADLRKAIRKGAIEVVDGQHLMPDLMIPAGEVLVREMLWGKRYCRDRLHVDVPVAWCADGFGLNAQMPQLYRKAGYRWVAFRRGIPRSIGEKRSEFWWEGLDGTRIFAHWMSKGYRAALFLDEWDKTLPPLARLASSDHVLFPCGSGSTPPQDGTLAAVRAWNGSHDATRVVVATPSAFFEAAERDAVDMPTWRGELYRPDLENVFEDVVTSRIAFKCAVRREERRLVLAEKLCTLAWLAGLGYPRVTLHDAWRRMLFVAFHDVIAGTAIDAVYERARADLARSEEQLAGPVAKALRQLAADGSTGKGLAVFNPHAAAALDWVESDVQLSERWVEGPGIVADGDDVPCEVVELRRWDDGRARDARIGFVAAVPGLAARVYEVVPRGTGDPHRIEVRDGHVRTPFYDVHVDPSTGILEVRDLEGELLVQGNEVVLDEENGDLYFQRNPLPGPIGAESGAGFRFGAFKPEPPEVRVSPARAVITQRTAFYAMRWPYRLLDPAGPKLHRHKALDVVKETIVYTDLPRIDFRTTIETRHPLLRIKVRFSPGLDAPEFTRETQFGAVAVGTPESAKDLRKVPSLTWLDAHGEGRGVAFLTRGAPFSEFTRDHVFLTLLRSVSVMSADGKSGPFIPTPGAQELGRHVFEYAVLPHDGDPRAGVARAAAQYADGLAASQVDAAAGPRPAGFALAPDALLVSALYKVEGEDAIILRFFESTGRACRARLRLPAAIRGAAVADLLERAHDDVPIEDGHLELDVGPFEIVTLRLAPMPPREREAAVAP